MSCFRYCVLIKGQLWAKLHQKLLRRGKFILKRIIDLALYTPVYGTHKEYAQEFRLKQDSKNISTMKYAPNLKQYFVDLGNVSTITLHDLYSVPYLAL